jgi:hypothetical protein
MGTDTVHPKVVDGRIDRRRPVIMGTSIIGITGRKRRPTSTSSRPEAALQPSTAHPLSRGFT